MAVLAASLDPAFPYPKKFTPLPVRKSPHPRPALKFPITPRLAEPVPAFMNVDMVNDPVPNCSELPVNDAADDTDEDEELLELATGATYVLYDSPLRSRSWAPE